MIYETPTKFLKAVENFFGEHKDKFKEVTKQIIAEGLTANPIFIATIIPFKEKVGVLFKQPTENDPFFIFITTLEVLTKKKIINAHTLSELKEKIEDPLKKATFIIVFEEETFIVFMEY